MTEGAAAVPVAAERLGPGQFLLHVDCLQAGMAFSVEGRTFTLVSKPVALSELNYLVTVHETEGPDVGRQLTVQLHLGPRRS
ncbi:hypothetical protein [Kribbella shirazensis]|jgi:hypothetical protein|uniref:Uncharacterized protein n=1 Tax=Kribbella shirazensis TaxID=1105143 RepID=A0A7X5VDQ1_9ACTN|nr:hypothetical protein [Kribbella shirazensis]NIK58448.1 hypothetical protein [Kribbella shirazensis]